MKTNIQRLACSMAVTGCIMAAQSGWAWSFGGVVWSDCDKDGIRQSSEAGIPGITIEVTSCVDGALIASQVTDSTGHFNFTATQVPIGGTYTVRYLAPIDAFSPTIWPPPQPFPSPTANQIVSTAVAVWGGNSPCFTFDSRFINGDVTLNNAGICITVPPCISCTRTPGYWKNHPEAWPVDVIKLGSITYTKADAIAIMKLPVRGDKTLNLAEQLIAAKLNILVGTDPSCICEIILKTDTLLSAYPVGSNLRANSAVFQKCGAALLTLLDEYNNGMLCAPHCED